MGDGPDTNQALRAAADGTGAFASTGWIKRRSALAEMTVAARVGWVLDDPTMPAFKDLPKVRDYLTAGTEAISTIPSRSADSVDIPANYCATSEVAAIQRSVNRAARVDPATHTTLAAAWRDLNPRSSRILRRTDAY